MNPLKVLILVSLATTAGLVVSAVPVAAQGQTDFPPTRAIVQ